MLEVHVTCVWLRLRLAQVDDEVECGSGVCNILMSDDKRTAYNAMLHITNVSR